MKVTVFLLTLAFVPVASVSKNGSAQMANSEACQNYMGTGPVVDQGDLPWLVRLQFGDKTCGSAVIDNQWVITAAHCFKDVTPRSRLNETEFVGQIIGAANVLIDLEDPNPLAFKKIVLHPQYQEKKIANTTGFLFDFALLQLKDPLDFSMDKSQQPFRPVCLIDSCDSDYDKQGALCTVTGWGTNRLLYGRPTRQPSGFVDQSALPLINKTTCEQSINNRLKSGRQSGAINVTSEMLCFGFLDGSDNDCQGDAGSPMVCRHHQNVSFFLKAIDSFGFGCSLPPGFFRIFARPCSVMPWIKSVTQQVYGLPPPMLTTFRPPTSQSSQGAQGTTVESRSTTSANVPMSTRAAVTRNGGSSTASSPSTTTPPRTPPVVDCGQLVTPRNSSLSITNNAPIGMVPWQAQIVYKIESEQGEKSVFYCGATILSRRWAITSKNCTNPAVKIIGRSTKRVANVIIGLEVRSDKANLNARNVPVEQFFEHNTSDLLLVKLRTIFVTPFLSSGARSICLPDCGDQSQPSPTDVYSVSGWGKVFNDERNCPSSSLRSTIRIRKVKLANQAGRQTTRLSYTTTQPSCDVDVGGPLAGTRDNVTYALYGVASADSTATSVAFESICSFKSWILSTTNNLADETDGAFVARSESIDEDIGLGELPGDAHTDSPADEAGNEPSQKINNDADDK